MRRIGNLKNTFLSFENIYSGFKKAFKATKNYSSYKFTFNIEKELLLLQEELVFCKYIPEEYRYFTVFEPKERQISVAAFRDRVVHHSLVNVLTPIYEKQFIFDSYATRKNKGTHKAIARALRFIKSNHWFLKMDIKKYFSSIDHVILNNIISRKIKDKFILDLCKIIISKGGDGKTGLPIGNLTSQFFANIYLDLFDHFIKDRLRIKSYIRYMDDFCVFSDDKKHLKHLRTIFTDFMEKNLSLQIKDKATLINSKIHGLSFLGVRIFPNLVRYKRENFERCYKKLKRREWEYKNGLIGYKRYSSSMQSITSHLTYHGKSLFKNKFIDLKQKDELDFKK